MNINLTCPVNNLGYGVASVGILKGLEEEGHKVSLWPISNNIECEPHLYELIRTCIGRQTFFDSGAPSLRIWHPHSLAEHIGHGRRVAFPFFELDRFNEVEKHHLTSQDLLLATSQWGTEVYKKDLGAECPPTGIVPLGVDMEVFKPATEQKKGDSKTVFFTAGKWELRKGHDVLIDAFNAAFEPKDCVELWMLCNNPFLRPEANNGKDGNVEWGNYCKSSKLGDKITVWPRLAKQEQVVQLMQRVDCGVFPSRGEGWNLELLEMMACGKKTIATDYSAHQTYCNEENCYLIRGDETESAYDGKWFFGQGEWLKFGEQQTEQLIDYMRIVHELKQSGGDMKNEAGLRTSQQFTWRNSAQQLVDVLSSY